MQTFEVVRKDKETGETTVIAERDTGADAAAAAKHYREFSYNPEGKYAFMVRPKKLSQAELEELDLRWNRAAKLQQDDAYYHGRRVVWHNSHWYTGKSVDGEHETYCHVHSPDRTMVRYIASIEDGRRGKWTIARPGTYLAAFYPGISATLVQQWVLEHDRHHAVPALKLARTGDEIVEVYTNGPNSCMSYSSVADCTRVYAGPDLAVAYITNQHDEISARAVVWPERKLYYNYYGDGRIEASLEAEGYKQGSLAGARIQRIPDGNGFVGPYIDGVYACSDRGDFLVLDHGGALCAENTDGTIGSAITCCNCGDYVEEGDECTDPYNGETWCNYCYDDNFVYCDGCYEYGRTDLVRDTVDGLRCESCYDSDYAECEICEDSHDSSDILETPKGESVCHACWADIVAECDVCYDDCAIADMKRNSEGADCCPDCYADTEEKEAA
jgi:hypothetical protein